MADKKMKLFVALAQKDNMKAPFEKMVSEREKTFEKKQDHFNGIRKSFTSKIEDVPANIIDGDFDPKRFPNEYKPPISSVRDQLIFLKESSVPYINTVLSVERTNASGNVKAPLVIDNNLIGTFSTAELLALQKFVHRMKDVYERIPTYDPQANWLPEKTAEGWYQSETNTSVKGTNVKDWRIVAPADQHQKQADVREITKNIVVGYYDTINFTTAISPKEKNDLLQRIQKLIVAVEVSIKMANDVEIVEADEASKIFDYIHTGII